MMLLPVVPLSKWLENYSTITDQQFHVKIQPAAASGRPMAFAALREKVLSERTKIKHLIISYLPL